MRIRMQPHLWSKTSMKVPIDTLEGVSSKPPFRRAAFLMDCETSSVIALLRSEYTEAGLMKTIDILTVCSFLVTGVCLCDCGDGNSEANADGSLA